MLIVFVQQIVQLEIDRCAELEYVVFAVFEIVAMIKDVAISIVNAVVGETESDGGRVLISYASAVTLRVIKAGRVEISLLITEVAAPLVVPFLVGIDEEQLRCTVVPRHIVGDRSGVCGIDAEAVRISYAVEGIILLLIFKAKPCELKQILFDSKGCSPSLRAIFKTTCNPFIEVLPVVGSLEGDGRCEVIGRIDAVGVVIHILHGREVAVILNPNAVGANKELFIGLPGKVKGVVHLSCIIKITTIHHNVTSSVYSVSRRLVSAAERVASNNSLRGEGVPCLRELETVYTIVAVDGVVVDVEIVVAFKVEEETPDAVTYAIGKHCVDIDLTDIESIDISITALTAGTFAARAELGIEAGGVADLLGERQTETVFLKICVESVRCVSASCLISAGEVSVKPELSGELPSAETIFKNRNALVNFVDLHAECVEFVFEFHDELLEEFEILLAGLVSVDRHEGARYY